MAADDDRADRMARLADGDTEMIAEMTPLVERAKAAGLDDDEIAETLRLATLEGT